MGMAPQFPSMTHVALQLGGPGHGSQHRFLRSPGFWTLLEPWGWGGGYAGVQGPPSPGRVAAVQAQAWPLVRVEPGTLRSASCRSFPGDALGMSEVTGRYRALGHRARGAAKLT